MFLGEAEAAVRPGFDLGLVSWPPRECRRPGPVLFSLPEVI